MKTDPGYALVSAVMATAEAFLRESQRFFKPQGLSAAQYNVINVLADAADGMSQRELSDHLVVDRSNVTGLIDRIERAGWVKRTDDPADRRVHRVVLTPSGRKLWAKVTPLYRTAVAQVTRGLTQQRMDECLATLRMLERSADAWRERAAPKGDGSRKLRQPARRSRE